MEYKITVTLVTKNQYKIDSMKKVLEPRGIKLDIESFEVPEIQADSCEEVARFSAEYAANECGKPVVKIDSGIFIEALNGLPGIYASQFQKKLGPEKVLKLMEGETNRKAKIIQAVAYCEPGKAPIVFSGGIEGIIADEVRGEEGMLIDFIFIPKGSEMTMGELRKADPEKRTEAWGDAKEQFIVWMTENLK
jgi:XTP/dITP diphosphohydrolase